MRLDAFRAVTEDAVSVPVTPVSAYALDVTPNPSTADARIRFTLPVGGETRLRVYDCAGRLVRELASGEEAAGEHVLLWDGADSQGRRPSAGIYVMRLDTAMGTRRTKFVRTR
jgi:flagellar hook assembly protein FlgD